MMFLLEIFIGVLIYIVGLRLCQYHHFWIIDSRCSTNLSAGQESPLVFLLKVWSHLVQGMGFIPLVHQSRYVNFMDMNNPSRE
jgi:hypothetical protein